VLLARPKAVGGYSRRQVSCPPEVGGSRFEAWLSGPELVVRLALELLSLRASLALSGRFSARFCSPPERLRSLKSHRGDRDFDLRT